jgi:hypothetical protein
MNILAKLIVTLMLLECYRIQLEQGAALKCIIIAETIEIADID